MWKIIVAFVVFAALGLWLLMRAGDKVDLGGEKHDSAQESVAPKKDTPQK
jgi:hypothetical protein